MFNKKDQERTESSSAQSATPDSVRESKPVTASPRSGAAAVIGPSIQVDGKLKGEEDLVIEGKVKGTVELHKNSVTIGSNGDVQADIHAHTIYVDGSMNGNLVAAERIVVRKSARVQGSIVSPRVSLEDGASFNGTIDMDPESEALAKAFGKRKSVSGSASATPSAASPAGKNGKDSGAERKKESDQPTSQALGL